MSLAANVKALRFEKGWGPADLAEAAGVGRTTLCQIESGLTLLPRARTAKKLADALSVKVADLTYDPNALSVHHREHREHRDREIG